MTQRTRLFDRDDKEPEAGVVQFSVRLPVDLVVYVNGLADQSFRSRNKQVEHMLRLFQHLDLAIIDEEIQEDIKAAMDVGYKLGRATLLDLIIAADKGKSHEG